jgi:hypothetical protein
MLAFVDESINRAAGVYIVAAAMVVEDETVVRAHMERLLVPPQRRIHWRHEPATRRDELIAAAIAVCAGTVVAVCQPLPRREARARAKCLEALLLELNAAGVRELRIESRQIHNDLRDRQTIILGQTQGWLDRNLTYTFLRPSEEPGLWLADIVAGAVSAERGVPAEMKYVDALGPLLRKVAVAP